MRLLLFVLGRATQKKTGLCDCCGLLWGAHLKGKFDSATIVAFCGEHASHSMLLFFYDARLRRRLNYGTVIVFIFWDARLRRRLDYLGRATQKNA